MFISRALRLWASQGKDRSALRSGRTSLFKHEKAILYDFHVQTLLQCHAPQHGWDNGMFDGKFLAKEEQRPGEQVGQVTQTKVRREFFVPFELKSVFVREGNDLFNRPHAGDVPAVNVGFEPFVFIRRERTRCLIIIHKNELAALAQQTAGFMEIFFRVNRMTNRFDRLNSIQ